MDVERVIFSVGQSGAAEAYERTVEAKTWSAHLVFFGDHLPATVFTSDTPKRLTKPHRSAIEQAVAEAGNGRYLEPLAPQYGSKVSRQLGRYFMTMAREALHTSSLLSSLQL